MKKSELIQLLQKSIEQHGDGDVCLHFFSHGAPGFEDSADFICTGIYETWDDSTQTPPALVLSTEEEVTK
jgi:hypothetical protein